MIQTKICLLGASAVGKTSLIRNFVHGIYSDWYVTTMGVKIDKKRVPIDNSEVQLIIWDINGEDEFQVIRSSYYRGSKGCLLVADGTRSHTLDKAIQLKGRVVETIGPVPFVLALNKADLQAQWQVASERVASLTSQGLFVVPTSAKTGDGVETAFETLARAMIS
jgi:small GTP-binding protein